MQSYPLKVSLVPWQALQSRACGARAIGNQLSCCCGLGIVSHATAPSPGAPHAIPESVRATAIPRQACLVPGTVTCAPLAFHRIAVPPL
jgi:hypothetical protein